MNGSDRRMLRYMAEAAVRWSDNKKVKALTRCGLSGLGEKVNTRSRCRMFSHVTRADLWLK